MEVYFQALAKAGSEGNENAEAVAMGKLMSDCLDAAVRFRRSESLSILTVRIVLKFSFDFQM